MSGRTDEVLCRLLQEVVMADEPLTHPSLKGVPDSVVRDHVKLMLIRGLVTGELHTAFHNRWTVYPGLQITRLGREYLSRRITP